MYDEYVFRSIFKIRVPSESIDRVVSLECFAHTNGDTDRVMKEASRALKRGKIMVFTDIMQADSADMTELAKVCHGLGSGALIQKNTHICVHDYFSLGTSRVARRIAGRIEAHLDFSLLGVLC